MTTDPILQSARKLISESLEDLRESIQNLPTEALNWRPTPDTNSIAVLVAHTIGATRLWLRMAMGMPLPERDRDSEFKASTDDAIDFQRFFEDMARDCTAALASSDEVEWSAMRNTEGRGGDAPPQVSAAYALIHVTEHLRGHVDQVSLMRHLWLAANPRPS